MPSLFIIGAAYLVIDNIGRIKHALEGCYLIHAAFSKFSPALECVSNM